MVGWELEYVNQKHVRTFFNHETWGHNYIDEWKLVNASWWLVQGLAMFTSKKMYASNTWPTKDVMLGWRPQVLHNGRLGICEDSKPSPFETHRVTSGVIKDVAGAGKSTGSWSFNRLFITKVKHVYFPACHVWYCLEVGSSSFGSSCWGYILFFALELVISRPPIVA